MAQAGVGQPLRVPHRPILAPAIAVVHEIADRVVTTRVNSRLERIEHAIGAQRREDATADDAASEDVDHEADVEEAGPRGGRR
jgi:hypothetical protein